MKTVLIGHRGAGKTALLCRLQEYFPGAQCLDLDCVIEEREGKTIAQIFRSEGETAFRQLEARHFQQLLCEYHDCELFLAVGAGFEMEIPTGIRVLWVRRETDCHGRILLDRPRLDPKKSQLETFCERFASREARYEKCCHEVITIPEGFERLNREERDFFCGSLRSVGGMLTILSGEPCDETWLQKRLQWGLDAIELRPDLLSPKEFAWWSKRIPQALRLVSADVHDLHDRLPGETILDAIHRLQSGNREGKHLKLAVEINSFQELAIGDRWMRGSPMRRSFLPRSRDGRWGWYRQLRKGTMKLNFIREGKGSAPDQPLLFDWLRSPKNPKSFAAILGDPVDHSLTPAFHHVFFSNRQVPVFRIRMTKQEWEAGGLDILWRFGLRFAAVTSPLKQLAFAVSRDLTPTAIRFESVNTLVWKGAYWFGTTTDPAGFASLISTCGEGEGVAVWGAGALLPMMREQLPKASFSSSRTGALKAGPGIDAPQAIIWATNHRSRPPQECPPQEWRPQKIIDLNYTQHSSGLDYAEQHGISYTSGMKMFEAQAKEQQAFWREHGV